jgi:hypothetical protein
MFPVCVPHFFFYSFTESTKLFHLIISCINQLSYVGMPSETAAVNAAVTSAAENARSRDVEQYFAAHRIPELFGHLAGVVVRDQPPNPAAAMLTLLRSWQPKGHVAI